MQTLNISVVQTTLHWEDIESNLKQIGSMIEDIRECDLIILPEMFSTGFSMRPEVLAEDSTRLSIPWMQKLSRLTGAALCGSIMHAENGSYFNALAFVRPDGSIEWYYKRHLFSPGEESRHYRAGKERLITELKGWKICPLICYDLRFPVFSRNDVAYDMLIYIANWPASRNYAWQQLLKARAIENQAYVIACNRLGEDGNGVAHAGNSCIVNFMGEEIGFSDAQKVYRFNLNKDAQDAYRIQFPVLEDRDGFTLMP